MTHALGTPVQVPITGEQLLGGPSTPEGAIAEFYTAFNGHDAELMKRNWDDDWGVTNDNQLGGIQRGREEVLERYGKIFDAAFQVYAEFVDYTIQEGPEFFLAVGRERGHLTKGDEKIAFQTRDTRLFRRVGDRWRQLHHHGSFEDPALMKRFQEAAGG